MIPDFSIFPSSGAWHLHYSTSSYSVCSLVATDHAGVRLHVAKIPWSSSRGQRNWSVWNEDTWTRALSRVLTSTSWCQCSIGLRGLASMAAQCSLPGPSASLPTRHIPITSLWPMLTVRHESKDEKRKRGKGRSRHREEDRGGKKKRKQGLNYQPWEQEESSALREGSQ